jgi:PAS domain S-box-containing protein
MQRNWTFRLRLVTALCIAFLMALGVSVLSYVWAERQREDNRWVDHSHAVLGALSLLVENLSTGGASHLKFVLSGDPQYLDSYESSVLRTKQETDELRRLTSDNPRQQQLLNQLVPLLAARVAELSTEAQVPKQEHVLPKADLLGIARIDLLTGTLDVIRQMMQEEDRLLKLRLGIAQKNSRLMWITIVSGNILTLLFFLAASLTLNDEMAKRERADAKVRRLLEAAPDAMVVVNREARIVLVNAQAEKLFGYGREELLGQALDLLVPERSPENHPEQRQDFPAYPQVREVRAGPELHGRRKDGSEFPVEISLSPLETEEGVLISRVIRDVTESKRAEEALRQSEQRYRLLVEGAPYGIFQADSDGRLLMVNPVMVTMLGYGSVQEVLRLNAARDIFADPEEGQRYMKKDELGLGRVIEGEAKWKRQDGSFITVTLSGSAGIRSGDKNPIIYEVFVENITEQKLMQQQFLQAQKMEAIGRLAGGVAHDFNNLLMIITSFAQLIDDYANDPEKVSRCVVQIRGAADKAALVTRQLLAFSRKQIQELKLLNLNVAVTEFCKMLSPLLGEDLEIAVKTTSDDCLVFADRGQIEQVIMNLAVNARDAMSGGGQLTIETAHVDLGDRYGQAHDAQVPPGRYAMLAVTDTGSGIDPLVRARIFEPFFTTKEVGKGTGLGLATVYGIVKQNRGFVWVYSEVGKGTTFKVYLPQAHTSVKADIQSSSVAPEEPIHGGHETILLVEDEAALLAVNREFLQSRGYTILEARNAAEALRVSAIHPSAIHLLLTDMVMPGIGGAELAKSILATRPETRVIYMSGYTGETVDRRALAADSIFLQKPFGFAALAQAIRSALDKRRKKSV